MPRSMFVQMVGRIFMQLLFVTWGFVAAMPATAETLQPGPLAVFERSATIRISDCEANYKNLIPLIGSCVVHNYAGESGILLDPDSIVKMWKYDSGNGWRLRVNVHRVAQGYRIDVAADPGAPEERLKFPIVEKYIRGALGDVTELPIKWRVIRSDNDVLPGETRVGPLYVGERSIPIHLNRNLFDLCLGKSNKRTWVFYCALSFVNSNRHEVALDTVQYKAELKDAAGEMTVEFNVSRGLGGFGAMSLANFTVLYQGARLSDDDLWKKFVRATATQDRKPIRFRFLTLDSVPRKGSASTEVILGQAIGNVSHSSFHHEHCAANWNTIPAKIGCEYIENSTVGIRVIPEMQLMTQGVWLADKGYMHLTLNRILTGIELLAIGAPPLVADYEIARLFVDEAFRLSNLASIPDYSISW